jgi:hypothetical protein
MLIPSARQFRFCAILLMAIPNAVAAQDNPDFSGRWVLAATDTYQIGVQGGVVGGGGTESRYSVRWEGNRLVIETGSYSDPARRDGPYSVHMEERQLDAAGRIVLSVTDRRSGAQETSNTLTLTYQKN